MSQWTHIRGCLELSGSVLAENPNKKTRAAKYYLPYPEKQVFLSAPKPIYTSNSTINSGIKYNMQVYCLPRCQEIIDKSMELLPSGEHNKINYSTYQPKNRFRSGSNKAEPWEEKIFKERIIKQYQENEGYPISWKEIKKYFNINLDWVDYATDFTLTISDDLRYCSGPELLVALEKVIDMLLKNDIAISDGVLNWTDDWEHNKFQCVANWDSISFNIFDPDTGTILATKKYKSIWNSKTSEFEKSIEQSENWNTFIPEVLYEQENRD